MKKQVKKLFNSAKKKILHTVAPLAIAAATSGCVIYLVDPYYTSSEESEISEPIRSSAYGTFNLSWGRDLDLDGIFDINDPFPFTYGPWVDMNGNGRIDARDLRVYGMIHDPVNFYFYPRGSFFYGEYPGFQNYWGLANQNNYFLWKTEHQKKKIEKRENPRRGNLENKIQRRKVDPNYRKRRDRSAPYKNPNGKIYTPSEEGSISPKRDYRPNNNGKNLPRYNPNQNNRNSNIYQRKNSPQQRKINPKRNNSSQQRHNYRAPVKKAPVKKKNNQH